MELHGARPSSGKAAHVCVIGGRCGVLAGDLYFRLYSSR